MESETDRKVGKFPTLAIFKSKSLRKKEILMYRYRWQSKQKNLHAFNLSNAHENALFSFLTYDSHLK